MHNRGAEVKPFSNREKVTMAQEIKKEATSDAPVPRLSIEHHLPDANDNSVPRQRLLPSWAGSTPAIEPRSVVLPACAISSPWRLVSATTCVSAGAKTTTGLLVIAACFLSP
jgi:hypothetical protein